MRMRVRVIKMLQALRWTEEGRLQAPRQGLEMFAPLFKYAYSASQSSVSATLEAAPPQASLIYPKVWRELTDLRAQLTARGDLSSDK